MFWKGEGRRNPDKCNAGSPDVSDGILKIREARGTGLVMDVAFYEVLRDGLTFSGKVWAMGEIIPAKSVPPTVKSIWNNPGQQKERYGGFVVRPRPAGFKGQVANRQESELGVVESVGTGVDKHAVVGTAPPSLGPDGEVGIAGMKFDG